VLCDSRYASSRYLADLANRDAAVDSRFTRYQEQAQLVAQAKAPAAWAGDWRRGQMGLGFANFLNAQATAEVADPAARGRVWLSAIGE